MITKIIFTLSVIVACLWFASSKRVRNQQPLLVVAGKKERQRKVMLQRGTYIFMFIMVVAAALMIYLEVADKYTTVTVHVINTQTGLRNSYQARRDDVKASSFTTVDGRKVFVAGIERVEVETD
jgi:hypothetical protein